MTGTAKFTVVLLISFSDEIISFDMSIFQRQEYLNKLTILTRTNLLYTRHMFWSIKDSHLKYATMTKDLGPHQMTEKTKTLR